MKLKLFLILALVLFCGGLLHADAYNDACAEYNRLTDNKRDLSMLDFLEYLGAKMDRSASEAAIGKYAQMFTVTAATGLMHGLNSNPKETDVARLTGMIEETFGS